MVLRYGFIVVLVLLFFPQQGFSSEKKISEADETCMVCHGQELHLTFDNGDKMSAKVDRDAVSRSVHRIISCSDCHGFTAETHPKRTFKDRTQYRAMSAKLCTQCHTSHKTKIHTKLISQAPKGTVCIDCHGYHNVQRARELPRGNHYCLNCHSRKSMQITFKNGEVQSVHIDEAILDASVHSNLSCSDCHFGFSSEEHPLRMFGSKRDYSLTLSESCRRCHFDKYTRTLEGIHFNVLAKGNRNAPVCTDCHGAHSVATGRKEKLANARKCERCHSDIYAVYSQSVHGGALITEHNEDVPVCSDCHKAHDTANPHSADFRNAVPQMCGRCHADKGLMRKYGLSTSVVDTYLQDFHGITLKFYRQKGDTSKPIAVCIDCHGIHDITKVKTPNASIVKANLVKRCQKCHADATANFPDSWISHYEPTFEKAPLVFLINLTYKLFIPFMIIGLTLQILLHIWRYAVNR